MACTMVLDHPNETDVIVVAQGEASDKMRTAGRESGWVEPLRNPSYVAIALRDLSLFSETHHCPLTAECRL
jgi:hypothetical protein